MVFDEPFSFFKYCKCMSNGAVWCPVLIYVCQQHDLWRSLHSLTQQDYYSWLAHGTLKWKKGFPLERQSQNQIKDGLMFF